MLFCKEEWANISGSRCVKLVETYPKRLATVTAAKGCLTKDWFRWILMHSIDDYFAVLIILCILNLQSIVNFVLIKWWNHHLSQFEFQMVILQNMKRLKVVEYAKHFMWLTVSLSFLGLQYVLCGKFSFAKSSFLILSNFTLSDPKHKCLFRCQFP